VLDLTRVLAGPLCTMTLGDLGASVIKVERLGTGDDTRGWGPPFDSRGRSGYYLSINRNKLSVAADLDSDADRAMILALAAEADIVVDNYRPPTLESRGIDPAKITEQNERLIWCTITGFGAGTTRPGYDFVAQAECGWMAITGDPNGNPVKVGVALADIVAGKDAAIAILAALAARGAGRKSRRRLIISLADSARACLINVAQNSMVSGKEAKRYGNAHANIVPYQAFATADQPIVIAVGADSQWKSCALALGLEDLAADPALATNTGRLKDRDRLVQRMQSALSAQPASYWVPLLEAAQVPSGVVKTVLQALEDSGSSPTTGVPSSVGGTARLEPPLLDEHGAQIRARGWEIFS
jgi:crotonobetainyl-CoA:carnitine CoA-transferase CaiB-like acyl-CoA transferase